MSANSIPIKTVATRLSKAEHTIRGWVRDGLLPDELKPQREGGRNMLVWDESQMAGLEAFSAARDENRGWGSRHRASSDV